MSGAFSAYVSEPKRTTQHKHRPHYELSTLKDEPELMPHLPTQRSKHNAPLALLCPSLHRPLPLQDTPLALGQGQTAGSGYTIEAHAHSGPGCGAPGSALFLFCSLDLAELQSYKRHARPTLKPTQNTAKETKTGLRVAGKAVKSGTEVGRCGAENVFVMEPEEARGQRTSSDECDPHEGMHQGRESTYRLQVTQFILFSRSSAPHVNIAVGSGPVSSSLLLQDQGQLLVATGNKITSVPLIGPGCDQLTTCTSCLLSSRVTECGWCNGRCTRSSQCRSAEWSQDHCAPVITKFWPSSAPVRGATTLTICGHNFGFDKTDNFRAAMVSVEVGGASCKLDRHGGLNRWTELQCTPVFSANFTVKNKDVKVTSGGKAARAEGFTFGEPVIHEIFPTFGPKSGNTMLTIRGAFLDSGNKREVTVGKGVCKIQSLSSSMLTCKTPPQPLPSEELVRFSLDSVELKAPKLFSYNKDPIINSIQPSRSFVRAVFTGRTTPPSSAPLRLWPNCPAAPLVTKVSFILDGFSTNQWDLVYVEDPLFQDPKLTSKDNKSVVELKGDRMDREAMKCQVLTVSNHSCETLTLVGNTLECTVPHELQQKELQVQWRQADSIRSLGKVTLAQDQDFTALVVGCVCVSVLLLGLFSLLLWRRNKHIDDLSEVCTMDEDTSAPGPTGQRSRCQSTNEMVSTSRGLPHHAARRESGGERKREKEGERKDKGRERKRGKRGVERDKGRERDMIRGEKERRGREREEKRERGGEEKTEGEKRERREREETGKREEGERAGGKEGGRREKTRGKKGRKRRVRKKNRKRREEREEEIIKEEGGQRREREETNRGKRGGRERRREKRRREREKLKREKERRGRGGRDEKGCEIKGEREDRGREEDWERYRDRRERERGKEKDDDDVYECVSLRERERREREREKRKREGEEGEGGRGGRERGEREGGRERGERGREGEMREREKERGREREREERKRERERGKGEEREERDGEEREGRERGEGEREEVRGRRERERKRKREEREERGRERRGRSEREERGEGGRESREREREKRDGGRETERKKRRREEREKGEKRERKEGEKERGRERREREKQKEGEREKREAGGREKRGEGERREQERGREREREERHRYRKTEKERGKREGGRD
ncbi:hypothetical protein WMY93_011918 [Mugilogobius chulae]|uniref:Sema domain-containing protein n=1 Tax=Mugilogobius chulae TaxID=88201 RepID=A0AAW0P7F2_9GOBI